MPPRKKQENLTLNSEVDDVLSSLQDDLNAVFGDKSATRLDSPDSLSRVDYWVSTRSMVVDSVLRGGRPIGSSLVPFGRQVEIAGTENSGKTTLCAQIAAETQSKGGLVIITDTEERVDHTYWSTLGVDLNRVLRIQASTLEDVFDKQYRAIKLATEKAPNRPLLIIWDSVGSTSLKKVIDVSSEESPMTQAAKVMMNKAKIISAGMELINTVVSDSRCCYLYTNHVYDKPTGFGDKVETPGGRKLKYFATVRLRLMPVGGIREQDVVGDNEKVIGQKVLVKAIKNSASGVLLTREAVIMAGKGFSDDYTIFTTSDQLVKAGSWTNWETPSGEVIKFQGWRGFQEKVMTHPDYISLRESMLNSL